MCTLMFQILVFIVWKVAPTKSDTYKFTQSSLCSSSVNYGTVLETSSSAPSLQACASNCGTNYACGSFLFDGSVNTCKLNSISYPGTVTACGANVQYGEKARLKTSLFNFYHMFWQLSCIILDK